MGRIFKMNPVKARPPKLGALPKREAGRGEKPRVVVGTAAARALGIK